MKKIFLVLITLGSLSSNADINESGDINIEAELQDVNCKTVNIAVGNRPFPVCVISLVSVPQLKLVFVKDSFVSKYPHFNSVARYLSVVNAKFCKNDYGKLDLLKFYRVFGANHTYLRCWDIDSLTIKH